jgi:predicted flap endonuclease-1-like 5' DNA nuclease
MFKEWGFLLGEIWFLLAVAGLIGLLAGWIIWGRRDEVTVAADTGEADRLRADLAACRAKGEGLAARVAELEARPGAAPVVDMAKTLPPTTDGPMVIPQAQTQPQALMGGAAASARAAVRPATLDRPRGGKADDLKLIKGVGPKLEKLCNKLGFWHFDQIANWTPAEVAWVDDNLEGFKGRVSREDWIAQARDLAAGKPPRPGGER